jgi:hypothetical protein
MIYAMFLGGKLAILLGRCLVGGVCDIFFSGVYLILRLFHV